jgi:tryptophan-rich sensory protein
MIVTWLVIAISSFILGFVFNKVFPSDYKWFKRLRRPQWLTFEGAIPFIWIFIFMCGITSAASLWETTSVITNKWLFMAGYVILECVILAYTPVLTRLRNVMAGAMVGGFGFILGLVFTIQVWQISSMAGWLLLPYLLWSPIGTYVTWVMAKLNP